MNLNFKTVEEKKVSPFLSPGSGIVLKINNIVLDRSQNTNNLRPVFFMEGEPVNDPTFSGVEGAVGKVGKVSANAGYYLNSDNNLMEFLGALKTIARALGKEKELEELEAPDLPSLIPQVVPILKDGYARYFIAGREFPKENDRYGVKLVFPNRNFVESVETNPSTLPAFDKNNPKHYTKLPEQRKEVSFKNDKADNLPF